MSSLESPLNKHAAHAEEYMRQGLLIPAAEAHSEAAQAFLACIEQSNDEHTKRTLRLLYNDHLKATRELERRISKLREENKNPELPQKPVPQPNTMPSVFPRSFVSPPPQVQGRMAESHSMVDESFMVLGQRSDPGDAFNQFWKIMEGMLDNLSQPVAFATVPLGPTGSRKVNKGVRREGSSSSEADTDDYKASKTSRYPRSGSPLVDDFSKISLTSFPPRAPPEPEVIDLRQELEEVSADGLDDLSESFCLIPSGTEPSTSKLKKDNAELKAKVEEMQQRLSATERMLKTRFEQDQQLRDSIMLARKEAQRVMGASTVLQQRPAPGNIHNDINALRLDVPPIPGAAGAMNNAGREREAQLTRRMRELEEEVRGLRVENEKQKAMIVRFRERWEKLKESAKKKKSAKAAAEAEANAARDRIEEEPEAEQEQELQPYA